MITRILSAAAAPVLAVGLLAVGGPAASAAPSETITEFTHACAPDVGAFGPRDRTLDDRMVVTAPKAVGTGEEFTLTMAPGVMTAARNTENRIKYDLAVPDGAELLSYRLVPDTGSGFDTDASASPPSVIRIGADGHPSDTGQYLRISGDNQTIRNGPNSDDSEYTRGLRVTGGGDFQLPAVEMTLRAPEQPGTVTTGIRTGAATPAKKVDETSYSSLVSYGFGNNPAWYCVAQGAGRGALSTTTVIEQADTTTTVTLAATAQTGDAVEVTATVTPAPSGGEVEFRSGDRVLGRATVGQDGRAAVTARFGEAGTHTVTATYLGTAGFAASDSPEATITVTVPVVDVPGAPIPGDDDDTAPAGSLGSLTGSLGSLSGT
ncbi:Ig-like domain-containing protein [Dietzia sp. 179-F 9C3 NHS]|uniref:Ig-like domain-containing protein n=1 Tax=Dietzia sp. 179-F 9C3 NHS TaxID=3374295 RepID=UPI0038799CD9